jgi:hypothetical protein
MRKNFLKIILVSLLSFNFLFAWGPHDYITKAALEVLPEHEKWENIFGKENINLLPNYSWMPDELHANKKDFFVDDYIINKQLPTPIIHAYPYVKKGIEIHSKRVLQAFRTENYREAFRQLGPLIHYLEDIGAPPHAKYVMGDFHGPMENWVKVELIKIKDYKVKIIGYSAEEFFSNLMKECEELMEFSKSIGEKTYFLVWETLFGTQNKREDVEALTLLSAKKCSEVLADCLYTIFKLSESFKREKVIEGRIAFPDFKFYEKKKGENI